MAQHKPNKGNPGLSAKTGHKEGNVTFGTYRKEHEVLVKLEALQKLDFGLSLAHLTDLWRKE